MKFRYFIMMCFIILLAIAGSYGGIYLHHVLRFGNKIPADTKQRYEYRYVGTEKFGNVFVTYRFDNLSGKIDRLTYTYYDEEKDSKGEIKLPAHESIGITCLNDGAQKEIVTENYRNLMIPYYVKLFKQHKDMNSPSKVKRFEDIKPVEPILKQQKDINSPPTDSMDFP
jgi:hypothetical protein